MCRTGGLCRQFDLLGRYGHKFCRAFGTRNLQMSSAPNPHRSNTERPTAGSLLAV